MTDDDIYKAKFRLILTSKENKQTGCWEWFGLKNWGGYGVLKVRSKRITAHRLAWIVFKGPFDSELVVRHKCDNRLCVNPEHLELGTQKDNIRDMHERQRSKYQAGNAWEKLTPNDVREIVYRRKSGEKTRALAQKFKVSDNHVYKIMSGELWSGVTGFQKKLYGERGVNGI